MITHCNRGDTYANNNIILSVSYTASMAKCECSVHLSKTAVSHCVR